MPTCIGSAEVLTAIGHGCGRLSFVCLLTYPTSRVAKFTGSGLGLAVSFSWSGLGCSVLIAGCACALRACAPAHRKCLNGA
jgi:hypothetical protein